MATKKRKRPVPSLTRVLREQKASAAHGRTEERDEARDHLEIRALQLELLRIQQGLFHSRQRAILVFEGFDAAGKGGAIRRLTEALDPRGVRVHPIGPPDRADQEKHWLYRFWALLPPPGTIAIFDRSWYGRVLVERVDGLTPKKDWRAFGEINELERMLTDDGIDVIKLFLAITKKEQRLRFQERMKDPYKQWKLTDGDLRARAHWSDYVDAADELLARTDTPRCPWHVVPADDKEAARKQVLKIVVRRGARLRGWIEEKAEEDRKKQVKKAMRRLAREG